MRTIRRGCPRTYGVDRHDGARRGSRGALGHLLVLPGVTTGGLGGPLCSPHVAADTTVTVTLTADDGTVEVSDALQVNITDSPNSPPTVNAGQDQEVRRGRHGDVSGTVLMTIRRCPDVRVDPRRRPHDHVCLHPAALSTTFTAPDVATRHHGHRHPDRRRRDRGSL